MGYMQKQELFLGYFLSSVILSLARNVDTCRELVLLEGEDSVMEVQKKFG